MEEVESAALAALLKKQEAAKAAAKASADKKAKEGEKGETGKKGKKGKEDAKKGKEDESSPKPKSKVVAGPPGAPTRGAYTTKLVKEAESYWSERGTGAAFIKTKTKEAYAKAAADC